MVEYFFRCCHEIKVMAIIVITFPKFTHDFCLIQHQKRSIKDNFSLNIQKEIFSSQMKIYFLKMKTYFKFHYLLKSLDLFIFHFFQYRFHCTLILQKEEDKFLYFIFQMHEKFILLYQTSFHHFQYTYFFIKKLFKLAGSFFFIFIEFMNELNSEVSMPSIFNEVFFNILGISNIKHDSEYRQKFQQSFFSYIRLNINQHLSFNDENIQLQIRNLQKKIDSKLRYVWNIFYEYGTILFFQKKNQFAEIEVSVIALSSWNSQTRINSNLQESHEWEIQNQHIKYFIRSISNIQTNLLNYSTQFLKRLNDALRYHQKGKTNIYHPKIFIEYVHSIAKGSQISHPNNLHFGYNYENNTGVESANYLFSLNLGLLFGLTSNKYLTKAICFSFKAYLLKRTITHYEQNFQSLKIQTKRSVLICLFRCLQALRFQIDQINSKYLNFQESSSILKDFSEKIHILDIPYKFYEISYRKQAKSLQQEEVAIPQQLLERKHKKISQGIQQITSINYFTISISNIFEEFNKKYQKIEKNQIQTELWMASFEDFTFTFFINQVEKPNPFYSVDIKDIQSRNLIQCLENYCCSLYEKEEKYGMYLKNTSLSHKLLIKIIFSIISFEVIKRKVSGTLYDLGNYKLPFQFSKLYHNFNSLSFKARKAMKKVYNYFEKMHFFTPIFQHSKNHKGYQNYAEKVYLQQGRMQSYVREKQKQLDNAKQKILQTIRQFRRKKDQLEMKIQFYEKMPCFCSLLYSELFNTRQHKFYEEGNQIFKEKKIKCERCKHLQNEQNQLFNHVCQNNLSCFKTRLPKQNRAIHGFCNGISDTVFYLVELLLFIQKEETKSYGDKAYFSLFTKNKVSFITFSSSQQKIKPLTNCKYEEIDEYISYSDSSVLMLWNSQYPQGIQYSKLANIYAPDLPQNKNHMKGFVYNPNNSLLREHQIYANLNLASFEGLENFIGLGSCRIGSATQLLTLLENITNRTMRISVLDSENRYIMHIVWLSVSSITSTDMLNRVDYNLFIRQSIKTFFDEYPKAYTSDDFFSLPILGPLFSLFSKIMHQNIDEQQQSITSQTEYPKNNYHPLLQFICQQALKQYKCLENDEKQSHTQQQSILTSIRNHQAFISFSALCCFTDNTISPESQLAEYFIKLILIYKAKSIFFQEGNKYYKAIENYNLIWKRAIHSNLRAVKKYCQKDKTALTSAVKIIDESIPQDVFWKSLPQYGQFIFHGESNLFQDNYYLNLENGVIIKNGRQMSGVPFECKQIKPYNLIFGQKSDYEIFPSSSGMQLRIRKNFSNFFDGNINAEEDSVFFQFEYEQKNGATRPNLSMIILYGKQKKEEKWVLLPDQDVNEILRIPNKFRKYCYPWYSRDRNCIMYRQVSLNQIKNVQMVIFLKNHHFSHSHLISPQSYTSEISFLCDPQNRKFEKCIFTKKNQTPESLKLLSSVEDQQYIYYLESQKKVKKFWFQRSNLHFEQHPCVGIVPSLFKAYRISKNPFNHQYLPWSPADQIACLVLQKIEENQLNCMMHSIRVLIPNFFINEKGMMKVPNTLYGEVKYYIYDLHDSFHDLRGLNRQSQLHMAAILIAINKGTKIPHIYLNGAEYSIKILKSCFSNRPLNWGEFQKVKIIFKIAIYQKNLTIILIIVALITITSAFLSKSINFPFNFYLLQNSLQFLKKYDALIRNTKTQYCLKFQRRQIPFREILPVNIAEILNIQLPSTECSNKKSTIPLKIQLPQIQKIFRKIEKVLTQIKKLKKSITFKKRRYFFHNKDFPIDFTYSENDILSQQIVQQLEESYEIYLDSEYSQLRKINRQQLLQQILKSKENVQILLEQLRKIMNGIRLSNVSHQDCVSSMRPFLSQFDYVHLLKDSDYIYAFYPQIEKNQKQNFLKLIKFWMVLKVQSDSLKRMKYILNLKDVDRTMLLRECQSPRQQIQSKYYWLCFEVQMKIQIWLSQYHTFQTLMNGQNNVATQLNMGQGKTQTIIPMIILENIYGKEKYIPRINLLSALFEESYSNYFKFLSITSFNIPIFQFTFNREFPFPKNVSKEETIKLYIRKSLRYFAKQMIILLDQSSAHSMILKLRDLSIKKNKFQQCNKQKVVFSDLSCFDIFDEVDAQMSPKKSFVYSVGPSSKLDKSLKRYRIHLILLEKFIESLEQLNEKNFLIYNETLEEALKNISSGQFPKGLRLSSEFSEGKGIQSEFRQIIFNKTFEVEKKSLECSFYQQLNEFDKRQIKQYIINEQKDECDLPAFITDAVKQNLFVFRGCLACGVLEHCLSLRCNVEYGVPDQQRSYIKKVAVPYEAAGIPSKRNEYSQPEVSIILSYLSYFNTGLPQNYFLECLGKLKQLNLTSQISIYQSWFSLLNLKQKKEIQLIPNAKAIKLNSASQIDKLFQVFSKNYRCIAFWLISCVFPSDLIQFTNSIVSSSWDHSQVKKSIGFSGTKDNSRVFPPYISFINNQNPRINGTDGKMIDLFIENTIDVVNIEKSSKSESVRFIETALNLSVNCLIDAGALLSGNSLKQTVLRIAKSSKLYSVQFKGITFCEGNTWKNYDLNTNEYYIRGTTLEDHETFVIFDEYRTRGSDMKLSRNAIGALSLSASLTKDSLMQAIGRLRKLGRNQKLFIILTEEVKRKIKEMYDFDETWSSYEKAKAVLNWCCMNSIKQNKKLMSNNIRLAAFHLQNKPQNIPHIQEANTSLKFLYAKGKQFFTLKDLSERQLKKFSKVPEYQKVIEKLRETYSKYGQNIKVKCDNFDDICEREVEIVRDTQVQKEIEKYGLLPEKQQIKPLLLNRQNNKHFQFFEFDKKFYVSKNFHYCTKNESLFFNSSDDRNELMKCYYVLITDSYLCMITQREASRMILGGTSLGKLDKNKMIARITDLTIHNETIKAFNLQKALTHAKFYNGIQNFKSQKEKKILLELFRKIPFTKREDLHQFVSYFLEKRKTFEDKYQGSSLAAIYQELLVQLDPRKECDEIIYDSDSSQSDE